MESFLYHSICNSTAHRKSREENRDIVLQNPQYFNTLFETAMDVKDKNHHKACWIMELVCEQRIDLLKPFLDSYCVAVSYFEDDQSIRSLSKINMFLAYANPTLLNTEQENKIIETCLDWLIQEQKVAAKAYSIYALYCFGKKHDWIYPELRTILTQDYPYHSAAYKAASKRILKKI